jgi:hypothetical protein
LSATDSGAQVVSTSLSTDPDLPLFDDIDGEIRTGPWDIGADEQQ